MTEETALSVGQIIKNINISEAANHGNSLAYYNKYSVFIKGGAIGDTVDVRVRRFKNTVIEADIVELITPSPDRTEAFCSHYDLCGGCQLQHINYDAQLRYKRHYVNRTLQKISGEKLPLIEHIKPATDTQFYRNKLSFSFSNNCWQQTRTKTRAEQQKGLGFHLQYAPDTVIDIDHCYLQSSVSNQIMLYVKQFALSHDLSFYDSTKNRGLLRDLVIRHNNIQQIMVVLYVSYVCDELSDLLDKLCQQFSMISSTYYSVNKEKAASFSHLDLHHHSGATQLVDQLAHLQYAVSPKAFYQTNPAQTVKLYNTVAEYAELKGNETVYDLYCGTGTIALWLAQYAKTVIGIEAIDDAIADAKHNATLNNMSNAHFVCGPAESMIGKAFLQQYGKPDVIVVDPPRAGLDQALCQQIEKLKPQKLIYVSCDAATQARDFKRLNQSYKVVKLDAVDMFPHTHHIETVALLLPYKAKAKPKKRALKY